MSRVVVEISPSVDGYVAGPGVSVERPFGTADDRLHRWLGFGAEPTDVDRAQAERMYAGTGAVVLGRRMFDVGIGQWGPDGAFGLPCFVVTNRPTADVLRGPTTFRFVTAGVRAAVEHAQQAAGDRDVIVVGGAAIVAQALAEGLVDEIRLHVVPVLLGGGTRLVDHSMPAGVELSTPQVVASPHATHLTYEVLKPR